MIGKTISHYQILEKLGGGGMGVVYKARDLKLDRFVALKFLPPHLSVDEEAKQRFIAEAKAASALDHPNIAVIHEIGETEEGELFIAMAFYDGETLKKKVASGKLQVAEATDIAIQIAQGLARAHEAGITHRDIKPANIMVTNRGEVKIVDFGLAKMAHVDLTKPGSTLGTAAYMSPEQARGEPVEHRTDIWALGVVLYEMLTGQLPFRGEYEQAVIYSILHEAPQPVSDLRDDVSSELEAIVSKALAKKADERYQSAVDLLSDLQQRSDTTAHKATMFASKAQGRSKTGFLALGAIGLAAMIALFIYLQTGGDPKPIRLTNPQKITQAIGLENYPTWSPDGGKIAYTSNQAGRQDIWMKQLSGGEPINMTRDIAMACWWPRWSPDGSQIAFVARQDGVSLWVMPAIGGAPTRVARTWNNSNPAWSANGALLAHVRRDSTGLPGVEIYTLSTYEKSEVALPGEQWERGFCQAGRNKR